MDLLAKEDKKRMREVELAAGWLKYLPKRRAIYTACSSLERSSVVAVFP